MVISKKCVLYLQPCQHADADSEVVFSFTIWLLSLHSWTWARQKNASAECDAAYMRVRYLTVL